jgi:hypothetical protein
MIKPHSIEDARRRPGDAGIVSRIAREPELARAAHAAIMEPRARANRLLLQRAIDRGEIAPDVDLDTVTLSCRR